MKDIIWGVENLVWLICVGEVGVNIWGVVGVISKDLIGFWIMFFIVGGMVGCWNCMGLVGGLFWDVDVVLWIVVLGVVIFWVVIFGWIVIDFCCCCNWGC